MLELPGVGALFVFVVVADCSSLSLFWMLQMSRAELREASRAAGLLGVV